MERSYVKTQVSQEKNAASIYDNFIIKNIQVNLKTLNFQFYAFILGQMDRDI